MMEEPTDQIHKPDDSTHTETVEADVSETAEAASHPDPKEDEDADEPRDDELTEDEDAVRIVSGDEVAGDKVEHDKVARDKYEVREVGVLQQGGEIRHLYQQTYNLNRSAEEELFYHIRLEDMEADAINRIEQLFVPPPGYTGFIDSNSELHHRLLLIHGTEPSVRFNTAVKVGVDLFRTDSNTPEIKLYQRRASTSLSLYDFVNSPDLPTSTVFIIENVFDSGVTLRDLPEQIVWAINHKLVEKGNLLILTTDLRGERLAELPAIPKLHARVADWSELFNCYLDFYRNESIPPLPDSVIEVVNQKHPVLRQRLTTALQVARFCQELGRIAVDVGETADSKKELERQIVSLADQIGDMGHEILREWFEALSLNEKLFAMLVVLLPNLDFLSLSEFYTSAVHELRRDKTTALMDPREQGIAQILTRIKALETPARQVEFISPAFTQEVRRQIRSYHVLLWSLIELLKKFIELFKGPEYWELRRELGNAIGLIGIDHQPKLVAVLTSLASDKFHGVQVVAGYALAEMARQEKNRPFIMALVKDWTERNRDDLNWASAAAIWRIYLVVADSEHNYVNTDQTQKPQGLPEEGSFLAELQIMLSNLAHSSSSEDVVSGVIFAVRSIAQNYASHMVSLTKQWLSYDEQEPLNLAGRLAAVDLFLHHRRSDITPTLHQHEPLLDVIQPLLSTDQEVVDMVMSTLVLWMEDDQGWQQSAHKALLDIANNANQEEQIALREGSIDHLINSENPEIRKIGQALILRSYVMQGKPVDLPGCHSSLLALDNSRVARERSQSARLGHFLYYHMSAWSDVGVVNLGACRYLMEADKEPIVLTETGGRRATARLIQPIVEASSSSYRIHSVIIACWGNVVDFDDLLASSRAPEIGVIAVDHKPRWASSLPVPSLFELTLKPNSAQAPSPILELSSTHLDPSLRLIDWLHAQLATTLARRDSPTWWEYLSTHFQQSSPTWDEIVAQLTEWIANLSQPEVNRYPEDPARLIACTILWQATVNLENVVHLLNDWFMKTDGIGEESTLLHCRLAIACSRMLFELNGPYAKDVSTEQARLLSSLLTHLSQADDWALTATILIAVRHWLTDETILQEYSTSSEQVRLLATLLHGSSVRQHRDIIHAIIQRWTTPLESRGETAVPYSIQQLVDQLKLYLFVDNYTGLPKLEEKHKYIFLVLDTSGKDSPERRHIALLAEGLVERLHQRNEQNNLTLLVFHLGRIYPLLLQENDIGADQLLPQEIYQRPRLLAPILEQTSVDDVHCALLLTSGPVLDQADWEKKWGERVKIYSMNYNSAYIGEIEVYPYRSEVSKAEQEIWNRLEKLGV